MPDGRDAILEFCRRNWVGPRGFERELLRERPNNLYSAGILFPQGMHAARFQREDHGEAAGGAHGSGPDSSDDGLDPIRTAQDLLPASAAISFHTTSHRLICIAEAGAYRRVSGEEEGLGEEEGSGGKGYRRRQLIDVNVELTPDNPTVPVLEKRAQIVSNWRTPDPSGGRVVTIAIVNTARYRDEPDGDWEDSLFQVELSVEPADGTVGEYPSPELLTLTDEDEDLTLIYQNRKTVAVGHGCAAAWTSWPDGEVKNVKIDFLPHFDVPALLPRESNLEVLRLGWLAGCRSAELCDALRDFISEFEGWFEQQQVLADEVDERDRPAALRVCQRIGETIRRMHAGVDRLESDPVAQRAFALANEAMLIQMIQSHEDRGGRIHDRGEAEHHRFDEDPGWLQQRDERWRPFQLAFQLLALSSSIDPEDGDRDLVDLIWFPTGGGKTEAYLAVAATVALYRRLTSDRIPGTDVITRYTLRLLTQQQFLRTARLTCALELIRHRESDLGDTAFTAGLWIGEDTPRNFTESTDRCGEILSHQRPLNRLGLERCPWCGTRIIPREKSETRSHYGFDFDNASFNFRCPDEHCAFSENLPVQSVDDALYADPPTFLVATVDKFARLAWLDEAGKFLGAAGRLPPGLIIQDELHLLSGPLGTTVGIYEAAISTVCRIHGASPKMVASTATIRDAAGQAGALYGRGIAVFPASGLSADDSWFAVTDDEQPGRRYVGVMSPCHTPSTSMVRISAILGQAVDEVDLNTDERDAYWTLIAYHNSLRELGKTLTFARDDIPARMQLVARTVENLRRLSDDQIVELTSHVGTEYVTALLSRLEAGPGDDDAIAFLVATSMFSVGVDVQRLGLMLVNGQPKTTSDYIQATSRVGRGEVPGLVVTHYSATKPRDRSHYEHFSTYHQALYRHVEPTSVTPFSIPSRRRALHAALVILIRHGLGHSRNASAGDIDFSSESFIKAKELFLERIRLADPEEAVATSHELERLVETWRREAGETGEAALYYRAHSPHKGLLADPGTRYGVWETMHSMRNVDSESPIRVHGTVMPDEEERTVRSSQALVPFGVGAIYDYLAESFVACDTTLWEGDTGRLLPFDRLAAKLGVDEFRLPPVRKKFGASDPGALPFQRFPRWLFCPGCRQMWNWPIENSGDTPRCHVRDCRGSNRLVPMRFVTICRAGHLGDVDWHRWAHSNAGQVCNDAALEFNTVAGRGGGLSSLEVRCRSCGSGRNLDGLTTPDIAETVGMGCPGRQPWEHGPTGGCRHIPLIVQRGASNVHYPQLASALDIPPGSDYDESAQVETVILSTTSFSILVGQIGLDGAENINFSVLLGIVIAELERQHNMVVSEERVRELAFRRWRQRQGLPPAPVEEGRIDWEEWEAFTSEPRDYDPRSDFVIRPAGLFATEDTLPAVLSDEVRHLVDSVTLAPRLREIRALTGFSRLHPPGPDPTQSTTEIELTSPSLGSELNWLPANETFGEGIFVRLRESRIAAWERDPDVVSEVEELAERLERSGRTWLPQATPRLVAVHTLAHLLIRQLCFECGYQSASLRERLYVDDNPETPMAGLLIYTTSGVTEGSLGGLVRMGEPPRFTRTLLSALDRARWCPADPVCSETAGGLDSLNRAACHACSLVSETSCAHLNLLLNRDLLVGPKGLARRIVELTGRHDR